MKFTIEPVSQSCNKIEAKYLHLFSWKVFSIFLCDARRLDENAQEPTEKLMYRRLAMNFTHLPKVFGPQTFAYQRSDSLHEYVSIFNSTFPWLIMEVSQTVFDFMRWRWKKIADEHEIKTMARGSLKKVERNAPITDIDIIFRHNTYLALLLSYSVFSVVGPAFGVKAKMCQWLTCSAYQQQYNFFSLIRILKRGRPTIIIIKGIGEETMRIKVLKRKTIWKS